MLIEAVTHTDKLLNEESGIDTYLSGSTMTAMLFDQSRIYTANSGDSRAMMCSYSHEKGKLFLNSIGVKVQNLTIDHKPDLPEEQKRVEALGGRVEPIKGPNGTFLGPMRVWLKDEDSPGLAMSRSMGD